jgi:hypothetical protein
VAGSLGARLGRLRGDPAFEALVAEIKERSDGYRALAREDEEAR